MESLVQRMLYPLDRLRFLGLRWTMRFPLCREIYLSKSNRLFIQHSFALVLALFSAVLFPTLSLVLAPIVYGIPHVISGARYLPRIVANQRRFLLVFPLMGILYFLGYLFSKSQGVPYFANYSDIFFFLSSFLVMSVAFNSSFYALKFGFWLRFCLVLLSAYLLFRFPIKFAVVMLIGHNFLAYVFWFLSCSNVKEKYSCVFSLISLCLVGFILFSGALDTNIGFLESRFLEKPWLNLKSITSSFLVLYNFDFDTLKRLTIFYAVSQTLHYFIWLKVIPEQFLSKSCPTGFLESYRILKKDVPRLVLSLSILVMGFYAVAHLFYSPKLLRDLYLIGISYHGMSELAALFALKRS